MLTDVPTIKSWIGITGTSEDAFLNLAIAAADRAIKQYTGRDLEQTTYPAAAQHGMGDSGFYNGDGSQFLRLRQYPVQSITNIWLDATGRFDKNPDGSFATASLLTEGTNYVLHADGCLPGGSTEVSYSGLVERIAGRWPTQRLYRAGNILPQIVDGTGNIKVAYVAGYALIPGDLVAAMCDVVAFMRQRRTRGARLQSESLGAYNYSLMAEQATVEVGSVRQILSRYRDVRF